MTKPIICANHFCNLSVIHKEGAPDYIAIHTDDSETCMVDGGSSHIRAHLPYAEPPDDVKCAHCDELIYYYGYEDDPGGDWIHEMNDKAQCGLPKKESGK